jgi:hypothetical protein
VKVDVRIVGSGVLGLCLGLVGCSEPEPKVAEVPATVVAPAAAVAEPAAPPVVEPRVVAELPAEVGGAPAASGEPAAGGVPAASGPAEVAPVVGEPVAEPTAEEKEEEEVPTTKEIADDAAKKSSGPDKDRKKLSDKEMLELLDGDDVNQEEFEKAFAGQKRQGVELPGAPK